MEAIKGLLEKYRYADKKFHIIIPIIIGLVVGYYFYSDAVPSQKEALNTSKEALANAETQYREAFKKKDKIKQLEADLEKAETMLTDLSKRLPNEVDIDTVLDNVARLAIKTETTIAAVEPVASAAAQTPDPSKTYTENVVKLGISGRFKDTIRFFDELLHLEKVVNLNNIRMSIARPAVGGIAGTENETGSAAARRERENMIIKTEFEIITYRSAT